MMSSHKGIAKCIEEDFCNFFDLQAGEEIVNQWYGFVFNHESPYQCGQPLSVKEEWSSPSFYIEDDLQRFKDRYNRRIEAFRSKLSSGKPVVFVHQGSGRQSTEVDQVLSQKYPSLRYAIIDITNHNRSIENDFLRRFGDNAKDTNLGLQQIGNCYPYGCSNMIGLKYLFDQVSRSLNH